MLIKYAFFIVCKFTQIITKHLVSVKNPKFIKVKFNKNIPFVNIVKSYTRDAVVLRDFYFLYTYSLTISAVLRYKNVSLNFYLPLTRYLRKESVAFVIFYMITIKCSKALTKLSVPCYLPMHP